MISLKRAIEAVSRFTDFKGQEEFSNAIVINRGARNHTHSVFPFSLFLNIYPAFVNKFIQCSEITVTLVQLRVYL